MFFKIAKEKVEADFEKNRNLHQLAVVKLHREKPELKDLKIENGPLKNINADVISAIPKRKLVEKNSEN